MVDKINKTVEKYLIILCCFINIDFILNMYILVYSKITKEILLIKKVLFWLPLASLADRGSCGPEVVFFPRRTRSQAPSRSSVQNTTALQTVVVAVGGRPLAGSRIAGRQGQESCSSLLVHADSQARPAHSSVQNMTALRTRLNTRAHGLATAEAGPAHHALDAGQRRPEPPSRFGIY